MEGVGAQDESRVSHPEEDHVRLETPHRNYDMLVGNDLEAGYVHDKVKEVLAGSHPRKRYAELLAKRDAMDEAPLLKVEELALVEQEYADVRRRLEMLIVKRNELRRLLRASNETPENGYYDDDDSNFDMLNRSTDPNFMMQDDNLRRYGHELLSPKAL